MCVAWRLPRIGSDSYRSGVRVFNQAFFEKGGNVPIVEGRGPIQRFDKDTYFSELFSLESDMSHIHPHFLVAARANVYWRKGTGPWQKGSVYVSRNAVQISYGTGSMGVLGWLDYDDLVKDIAERLLDEYYVPGIFANGRGVLIDEDLISVSEQKSYEDAVADDIIYYAIDDLEDQGLHCSASSSYVTCIGNIDGTDVKVVIRK